jgi:hypothetical protein
MLTRGIAICFFALLLGACGSTQPMPRITSPAPAPAPTVVPDNPVSEIAQREILRRQERIHQMDAAALGASLALSENDLEGAVSGFREASR